MPPAGPPFSQRERSALCDLLWELGPDAPTLCEGWLSADLAAHLATRDRRPDAVPGMVAKLGPLRTWTERAQERLRDATTWDALVGRVRSGPPPLLRPLDPVINTIEYFVHHEDLRRAQPGWEPRPLAAADEALLWRQLRWTRFMAPRSVARVEPSGYAPVAISKGGGGTVLNGPVGEVVLWLSGRKGVARVEEGSA
ncbi:MAG: TIGR03085 family metal-binding protein [Acidimicrobiales bacterium]